MSLYVFRNAAGRASKDTGIVRDYLTKLDRRGCELPVALSSRHRGSLLWRTLAAMGQPVARPRGLQVIRMRPPGRAARWLRRQLRPARGLPAGRSS